MIMRFFPAASITRWSVGTSSEVSHDFGVGSRSIHVLPPSLLRLYKIAPRPWPFGYTMSIVLLISSGSGGGSTVYRPRSTSQMTVVQHSGAVSTRGLGSPAQEAGCHLWVG